MSATWHDGPSYRPDPHRSLTPEQRVGVGFVVAVVAFLAYGLPAAILLWRAVL